MYGACFGRASCHMLSSEESDARAGPPARPPAGAGRPRARRRAPPTRQRFRFEIEFEIYALRGSHASRYESMSIDFILVVLIMLEHENRMVFICVSGVYPVRIGSRAVPRSRTDL
jgi:hypothetical protein